MVTLESVAVALEHAITSWREIERERRGLTSTPKGEVAQFRKGMQKAYAVMVSDITQVPLADVEKELFDLIDKEVREKLALKQEESK